MSIHPKDMVDPVILTTVKLLSVHFCCSSTCLIHPKDMVDPVIVTIVKLLSVHFLLLIHINYYSNEF